MVPAQFARTVRAPPPASDALAGSGLPDASTTLDRRGVLRLAGVGLAVGIPGCSLLPGTGGPRYSLSSSPAGGTDLHDLFRWDPRLSSLHVRYHADALVEELLDSGRLAVAGQPIAPYDPEGSPPPAYAEHEGAYYRVRVTGVEDVSLDRWEFWFEPVEAVPDDAEVVADPTAGLSALDADVVDRAADDAIGAVVSDEDLAAAPHGERGVVFFAPLEPGDSALVPDPPFEYVRVDPGTEFLDEPQTLRAHADRGQAAAERYVHGAERVADSRSALRDLLAHHLDARFDDPGESVRDVLAQADGGVYVERGSPSDAFARTLDRLGIADPAPPEGADASRAWRRYYEYDGTYYRTTFRVRND